MAETPAAEQVPLSVIATQWARLGCIGFGGPPAHIALLRKLVVDDRTWLPEQEFEDGVAAVNLLPGPASTQLTIYCAWRLRGAAGALIGGACFILPGLVVILVLSSVFLAEHPPGWIAGAALGAGAAVPAVAVAAAVSLIPASWRRAGTARSQRAVFLRRCQLAPVRPAPAWMATAGTAAPAPAPAPSTHSGGDVLRNRAASAKMTTNPGAMNAMPPASAPAHPRSRHAQKIAS